MFINGEIFIQSESSVYKYSFDKAELIFSRSSIRCFNTSASIFVKDRSRSSYFMQLVDGKLSDENKMQPGAVIKSWAGNIVKVQNGVVEMMQDDLSLKQILKTHESVSDNAYCQAGLSIADNSYNIFVVVDLVNEVGYETHDTSVNYDDSINNLVGSELGLTLTTRHLLQIFGKDGLSKFLKNREQYFEKWRTENLSKPGFPVDGLNRAL